MKAERSRIPNSLGFYYYYSYDGVVMAVLLLVLVVTVLCSGGATNSDHQGVFVGVTAFSATETSTRTFSNRFNSSPRLLPSLHPRHSSTHGRSPPLLSSTQLHLFTSAAAVTTAAAATTSAPAASTILSLVSSPLGALAILAGIVLIHELGHYGTAKAFGIKVEEFSIGFGPKLFGFQIQQDEFNLRALPLGGYVRFPENYNTTQVRQEQQEAFLETKRIMAQDDRMNNFGTILLNALTLGAVEDRLWKQKQQEYSKQLQEYMSRPSWKRIGTSPPAKLPGEVEIDYYDDPDLLQNRPWPQRAAVLSAGVVFNILLSFFIFFGEINLGPGLYQPVFEPGAVVSSLVEKESAARGILQTGDIIVGVNGQPLQSTSSISKSPVQAQKSVSYVISKIRETPEGGSISLSVVKGGKTATSINKAPPVVDIVSIRPTRTKDGISAIGVMLSPNYVKSVTVKSDSITESAVLAWEYVATLTQDTAGGLLSFAWSILSGKSSTSGGQVSGPIGLLKTGSEVVATQDWRSVLLFTAAISINLGVVNALPLPALDGGQLVFVLAEAITGRKVDQRVQEGITGATLLLLLLASVSAAVGDIGSIFSK